MCPACSEIHVFLPHDRITLFLHCALFRLNRETAENCIWVAGLSLRPAMADYEKIAMAAMEELDGHMCWPVEWFKEDLRLSRIDWTFRDCSEEPSRLRKSLFNQLSQLAEASGNQRWLGHGCRCQSLSFAKQHVSLFFTDSCDCSCFAFVWQA